LPQDLVEGQAGDTRDVQGLVLTGLDRVGLVADLDRGDARGRAHTGLVVLGLPRRGGGVDGAQGQRADLHAREVRGEVDVGLLGADGAVLGGVARTDVRDLRDVHLADRDPDRL